MPKTLTRKEWQESIREKLSKAASWYGEPYDHLTTKQISKVMWVTVEEALPEENFEVDIFGHGKRLIGKYSKEYGWITGFSPIFLKEVTHWTYPLLPEVK